MCGIIRALFWHQWFYCVLKVILLAHLEHIVCNPPSLLLQASTGCESLLGPFEERFASLDTTFWLPSSTDGLGHCSVPKQCTMWKRSQLAFGATLPNYPGGPRVVENLNLSSLFSSLLRSDARTSPDTLTREFHVLFNIPRRWLWPGHVALPDTVPD